MKDQEITRNMDKRKQECKKKLREEKSERERRNTTGDQEDESRQGRKSETVGTIR